MNLKKIVSEMRAENIISDECYEKSVFRVNQLQCFSIILI